MHAKHGFLIDGIRNIDHCKYLGKNIDVTVTQILQTTAGRMIFAKVGGDAGGGYFYPVPDTVERSAKGKG